MDSISTAGFNAQSAQSFQGPRPQPITEDQKEFVESALAEFDPDNLTEDDAQAIVEAFKDAGIQPGKELAELMAEAGFDAKEVGDLAGVRPPGPPPGGQGAIGGPIFTDEMLGTLESLLEEYGSDELDDEAKDSILQSMQEKFGLESSDHLFSVQA